jgi:hypothetical protein
LIGALPVLEGSKIFSGRVAILVASVIAIVMVYVGLTAGRSRNPGVTAGHIGVAASSSG